MSSMNHMTRANAVLLAAALLMVCASGRVARAQSLIDDGLLNAETFGSIHQQIRPQPGESHWAEIPWLTDLHEARRKAAAEGKPLFIMASGKGISIGMC